MDQEAEDLDALKAFAMQLKSITRWCLLGVERIATVTAIL
jgi:hypothetical protein